MFLSNFASHMRISAMSLFLVVSVCHAQSVDDSARAVSSARQSIEAGDLRGVEALLKPHVADEPAITEAARLLEIARRIRYDYALTPDAMLEKLRRTIPDATAAEVEQWRAAGLLQSRLIDGQVRFFRSEPSNLYRFSQEARSRRVSTVQPAGSEFDLPAHVAGLLESARGSGQSLVRPVRQRVRYELRVNANHPRVRPGAKVRCWLPFPQDCGQQTGVRLVSTDPAGGTLAESGAPHRTVFFETVVTDAAVSPRFAVEFEYTCSATVPKLDAALAKATDPNSDLYREFTAARPPHIEFAPEVREIVARVIGDEANPLVRARRLFRWVSENIRYCSELEYSTIPNLTGKALATRRGDCGVQAMTFISLCRAAGIPARWQSGWETLPGRHNMHDWCEFYVEPWGWLPADPSYGVLAHADPAVQEFYCGHMDAYRLIVNRDYGRELSPPKVSFRSEPNDFQRGEIEIDGHNLYFDEWDWTFDAATTPVAGQFAGLTETLDAVVPDGLQAEKIPGAVIAIGRRAVAKDSRSASDASPSARPVFETWQKSYGFLSVEPRRRPMRDDAIFDLASLTKPIATGTSLMMLVEQGKLALDDPVSNYVHEFSGGRNSSVTVRQLATHTSGLPPYLGKAEQDELRRAAGFPCIDATRARVVATPATQPAGSVVSYSCLNAIMGERLIHAVSGQALDRFAAGHIFTPLRMCDSGFRPAEALRDRLAPTTRSDHGRGEGGYLLGQVHDPLAALQDGVSGNAGLFGTAADLARFAQMILNDGELDGVRILKPDLIREMTRAQTAEFKSSGGRPLARGLFWEIYPAMAGATGVDAHRAFGHTGFTGTALRIYPDQGVYIIVLTNRVHPDEKGGIAEFRKRVWSTVSEQLFPAPVAAEAGR